MNSKQKGIIWTLPFSIIASIVLFTQPKMLLFMFVVSIVVTTATMAFKGINMIMAFEKENKKPETNK